MREIKFRGKRIDNGEWVYGYYLIKAEKHIIWSRADIRTFEVIPETVGQFTGVIDVCNFPIFDGDILKYEDMYKCLKSHTALISWGELYWKLGNTFLSNFISDGQTGYRIISNIHDNPDLLAGKNEI